MNGISYTKNGDYYIPDLKLTNAEQTPLGKYGRIRKTFLREHRRPLYTTLCIQGTLFSHCAEIDVRAHEQLDRLIAGLAKSAGVNEALKAADPLRWAATMNALRAQVEEIILHDLVYAES